MPETLNENRLRFSFDEMLLELEHMSKVSSNYIDFNAITQLATDLQNIRYSNNPEKQSWSIDEGVPLRTDVCTNGYEPGDRTCTFKNVYGELSCIWQVRIEQIGTPKQRQLPEHFWLDGKCSTKIKIFDKSDERPILLAQWQFEVGDHQSPGCHFHCGILQSAVEPPFPKGLSVPRLPSILVTPMDGLDFLMSELLQQEWARHASPPDYDVIEWSKIQKNRFDKLLRWKLAQISETTSSAWLSLKRAKPFKGELFA